jgi:hypothetical protein
VPALDEQTSGLLEFYLLDKCLYELDSEFNNRPDWVSIPLLGLVGLLGGREQDASPGRGSAGEAAPLSTSESSAGSIT